MNRRSFLGSLLAAPIAAVMSLKWKPDPLPGSIKGGHYEMHIWDDLVEKSKEVGWEYYPRTYICHPNHLESMKKIMEQVK